MQQVALQQPGERPPAALASPAAAPAPLADSSGRDGRPCGWPTAGTCSRELQPGEVAAAVAPCCSLMAGAAELGAVAAGKDDTPVADQTAITNVAGLLAFAGGGGLIQTTDG
jgi:hypothetical protein